MSRLHHRTAWQLPAGVTQGSWEYAEARFIASDYDADFADHGLLDLDAAIVRRHLTRPGVVADLGCGTGRSLLPLIRDGFTGIAVDLSQAMLELVMEKASAAKLPVQAIRGNLVELGFLADECIDYALCLFSTLGMISGAAHRQTAVAHMHRILRPGGLLVLHVHNYWHNLVHPPTRGWLVRDYLRSWLGHERGNRLYDYHGIRNFYLHLFTQSELAKLLSSSGFAIREWTRIGATGDRPLARPWLASWIRTQGWIVVAEKNKLPGK